MKISVNLNGSEITLPALPHGKETRFNSFLDKYGPSCKGDEYYWQHQEQLQHSLLNFDPHPLDSTKPSQLKGDEPTSKPCQQTNLTNPSPDPMSAEGARCYTPSSECEMAAFQDFTNVNPIEPNPKGTEDHFCTALPFTKKTIETENNEATISSHSTIIRPTPHNPQHQLFIHEQAAELALNTHKLSREETCALLKVIKQGLSKKGYYLKQLIINGTGGIP